MVESLLGRIETLPCGSVVEMTQHGWIRASPAINARLRHIPPHARGGRRPGLELDRAPSTLPRHAGRAEDLPALDRCSAPLVTCLCLTKNRREWLPTAIECFERQTYPHRELLIVADSMADIEGLLPECDRIRWILTGHAVVGRKRNLGCEAARGEYVAIWDDDDFSAPGRLVDQVNRLERSRRAVTGYRSMKFTDGKNWWLYPGARVGFVLATSMFFRREWWRTHHFQEIQCHQDEAFATQAASAKQLEVAEDLDLMYATCHRGNTSARNMNASMWQKLPEYQWA